MYVLKISIRFQRSNLIDVLVDCSGMRENYSDEEVAFRGGNRALHGDRDFAKSNLDRKLQRTGLRLQRWMLGLLLFLLTSLLVLNTYNAGQFHITRFNSIEKISPQENYVEMKPYFTPVVTSGYLVRNKGCRIPAVDPYDPAVQRFIHKEEGIVCEYGNYLPLVDSNSTSIFINPKAREYFYKKHEKTDCCWRNFSRTLNEDNAVTYDNECTAFEVSQKINAEFVKIECSRKNEKIYKDYHAFVPRKPEVEERCRRIRFSNRNQEHLSVLIIGLDSVSRLNFHRMMPKTVKALQKLGAVEMLGYTKVADNTYPNLVPVLTGLSQEELQEVCWQNKKKPFDDCPFIWKNFSAAGYRTIFGEDACDMTTFNYLKPGFKNPPTDYYLRPFCIASEHDIGNTCKLNANLCVGTRKTFDNLISYAKKAASEFASDPYFGMFWQASLTHDFLNYPQLGDNSYQELILYLSTEGLLNNTALIVMSDHGMRWGDFRQTYQGRMEDSLPFVFIVLPNWWRGKYQIAWANLRRNSRSLTTAFDLHETMMDLLHTHMLNENSLRTRNTRWSDDNIPRGISWFLPVPDDRTCAMANISSHWCMCHSSSDISLNDPDLQESASFLVSELNHMLQKYAECAILSLKEIKDAKVWMDASDGNSLIDHTITLQTEPGNAVFEGSVRYRTDDKSRKLVGSVSRLNAYGKQSACVDEFNMRLYCYCL